MVAILLLLLLQLPPVDEVLTEALDPRHTDLAPVIAPGKGFTVMVAAEKHPLANE
jgi:hypothetical protein